MDIVVGVSGGIAAYKSVQLVRLLVKAGHEVTVVPTEDALRFVGAPTWEAISRHPVTTSVHDDVARVRHVALGQAADLVVVAPATANTLARMAAGIADNLLGTTLLATVAPVLVAPAMHAEMWQHPATQANIRTLRERGVVVVGPADGELAGGDSGPGRMAEPDEIADRVAHALRPQDLAGLRVVVSAGGTREPLDPVRFLGNRSSGRQGVAVALEAARRGAMVTLAASNVESAVLGEARHPGITVRSAGTATELGAVMTDEAESADVIVMAAAVADYRPAEVSPAKLSKEIARLERIDLVENEDIVAGLAATRDGNAGRAAQTIVAFAAETEEDPVVRTEKARRKRARKGVDLLVVNQVGWDRGFEAPTNSVQVLGPEGEAAAASGGKSEVAGVIWDAILAQRVR